MSIYEAGNQWSIWTPETHQLDRWSITESCTKHIEGHKEWSLFCRWHFPMNLLYGHNRILLYIHFISPWSKIYCFSLWCVTMRRWVNSWRPRDAIWWHKYGLTLAQVMVCWRLQAITWTNIDQHHGINSNYNDLIHYIQYKCFPKFPSYIQHIGGW